MSQDSKKHKLADAEPPATEAADSHPEKRRRKERISSQEFYKSLLSASSFESPSQYITRVLSRLDVDAYKSFRVADFIDTSYNKGSLDHRIMHSQEAFGLHRLFYQIGALFSFRPTFVEDLKFDSRLIEAIKVDATRVYANSYKSWRFAPYVLPNGFDSHDTRPQHLIDTIVPSYQKFSALFFAERPLSTKEDRTFRRLNLDAFGVLPYVHALVLCAEEALGELGYAEFEAKSEDPSIFPMLDDFSVFLFRCFTNCLWMNDPLSITTFPKRSFDLLCRMTELGFTFDEGKAPTSMTDFIVENFKDENILHTFTEHDRMFEFGRVFFFLRQTRFAARPFFLGPMLDVSISGVKAQVKDLLLFMCGIDTRFLNENSQDSTSAQVNEELIEVVETMQYTARRNRNAVYRMIMTAMHQVRVQTEIVMDYLSYRTDCAEITEFALTSEDRFCDLIKLIYSKPTICSLVNQWNNQHLLITQYPELQEGGYLATS